MSDATARTLHVGGERIACLVRPGALPCIVWLGGYRSDMSGTKAVMLDAHAAANSRAMLRLDYSGHGASGGRFEDGTISAWANQAVAAIAAFAGPRPILAGSSMGAWIALLAARRMLAEGNGPAGLLLIAPAPDFTAMLVEPSLDAAQRDALERNGEVEVADPDGGGSARYTGAFLGDGRANRVIDRPFDAHCPVRILQGTDDRVVPVSHALAVAAAFPADDVTMTLVPGGDHRLSRPDDLRLIVAAVEALSR